jgi:hypothetical protein
MSPAAPASCCAGLISVAYGSCVVTYHVWVFNMVVVMVRILLIDYCRGAKQNKDSSCEISAASCLLLCQLLLFLLLHAVGLGPDGSCFVISISKGSTRDKAYNNRPVCV